MAEAHREGTSREGRGVECRVSSGKRTTITCELPDGEYEVQMFAAPPRVGAGSYTLDYVGSILVNSH